MCTATRAGKERRWDVVESHASVGVVLYHKDLDAWIIVRQFRCGLSEVDRRS